MGLKMCCKVKFDLNNPAKKLQVNLFNTCFPYRLIIGALFKTRDLSIIKLNRQDLPCWARDILWVHRSQLFL